MSDRLQDLGDAPRQVDPVFRDAVRAELLATVAAGPTRSRSSRALARRRPWVRPVGLTAVVLAGLAGGGAVAVASGLVVLPGADRVELRSSEFDVEHTGTATIDLGTPPDGATHVEITFTCLDPGNYAFGDRGAGMGCSASDVPDDGSATGDRPGPGTAFWSQPLDEVDAGITITTTPDNRWILARSFSTHTPTEWGVNANGDTYGVEKPDGSTPDLVAVYATNGKTGYAYAAELNGPDFSSPEEALAWQEAGSYTPPVTVYTSDGTTVIGTFDNGSEE